MNLRKRNNINYKCTWSLVLGTWSRPEFYFKPRLTQKKRSYFLKQSSIYDEEIEHIKGIVIKSLISTTSRSPVVNKPIVIPNKFALFLKKNYSINNKWTLSKKFLEDYNFETERSFNKFDYCCIYEESFRLKITSTAAKYKDNGLKEKTYKLKPTLHVGFTVASRKKSN